MMGIITGILRLIIGVILVPLVIPVSKAFYNQLSNVSIFESKNHFYFLWGVGAYVIMHLFLFKPNFIYNLGHEFVHVLSTWLSFGRAGRMKVSKEGGSVQTSKSNFFISISPYFIPIYTVLIALGYFTASKFMDISNWLPYAVFFIGFTFAMHIIMTVDVLKVSQPDLVRTGYLFSLSLIYVINVIVAGLVISLVFSGFSSAEMILQFYDGARQMYAAIFGQLFRL